MKDLYIHIFFNGKKYDYKLVLSIDECFDLYKEFKEYFKNTKKDNINFEDFFKIISKYNYEELKDYTNFYFFINVIYNSLGAKLKFYCGSYEKRILKFYDNIIKRKIDGNCIDDFAERICSPLIEKIEKYLDDIYLRKDIRINYEEYHNTDCYENDFNQILKIKEISEKLSKLCNKQLEILSDKYTKS